jgi:acetyltransferase
MPGSTASIVTGARASGRAAPARSLEDRRGEAMRAMFPLLYEWRARDAASALPSRVYAHLAEAATLDELERRLREPVRRYPTELIERVRLRDGRAVLIRPVGPRDAPLQQAFVRGLSPQSRLRRFHTTLSELPPTMLSYLTNVDHVDHIALIAEIAADAERRHVAEARWVRRRDEPQRADFAIAVADDHQKGGLGARLMGALERSAAARGIASLHGSVLRSNAPMIAWLSRRGWRFRHDAADPSAVDAELALDTAGAEWREAA